MAFNFVSFTTVLFLMVAFSSADYGSYCEDESDCTLDQICQQKRCTCGYNRVPSGLFCFPVVRFGETCWIDEQCIDEAQQCVNTSTGMRRCACDSYHHYDFTVSACTPKHNLTEILFQKYNFHESIGRSASSTFTGLLIAGALIAGIGASCFVLALLYCFRIFIKDRQLDKHVEKLTIKLGKKGEETVKQIDVEQQKRLADASVGPIFQDDVVIG